MRRTAALVRDCQPIVLASNKHFVKISGFFPYTVLHLFLLLQTSVSYFSCSQLLRKFFFSKSYKDVHSLCFLGTEGQSFTFNYKSFSI